MSFDTLETSVDEGQPIYLYQFNLAATVWRYTSAQSNHLTQDGFLWKSIPISDDGVKQTGEVSTDALTITCPVEVGPVQVYMTSPPSTPISVRIWRKDYSNTEMIGVYSGTISQVDYPTPGTATLTCETTSASMAREGLRLGWQKTCPYAVYDQMTCKVDKTQHEYNAMIVSELNGQVTLEFNGADPGASEDYYFSGGFMAWIHPVRGLETRMIELQTGDDYQIVGQSDDLYPGTLVKVYPGCDQTRATCQNKFNNILNNGGAPDMPGKSPFDGTPVF